MWKSGNRPRQVWHIVLEEPDPYVNTSDRGPVENAGFRQNGLELGLLFRRQQIGNRIHNRVRIVALRTIERTRDYFFPFFLIHPKLQIPFAYGTGQDLHQFFLHFRFQLYHMGGETKKVL